MCLLASSLCIALFLGILCIHATISCEPRAQGPAWHPVILAFARLTWSGLSRERSLLSRTLLAPQQLHMVTYVDIETPPRFPEREAVAARGLLILHPDISRSHHVNTRGTRSAIACGSLS